MSEDKTSFVTIDDDGNIIVDEDALSERLDEEELVKDVVEDHGFTYVEPEDRDDE